MAATAEFKLSPSARLYLGTDLLWNSLGYQPSDEVDYTLAGVRLYALYRFSGYWDGSVFGTIIIPYVKLGGGAVFVQARDGSAGAAVEFQGSMTSMASVQVGADFRLPACFFPEGVYRNRPGVPIRGRLLPPRGRNRPHYQALGWLP